MKAAIQLFWMEQWYDKGYQGLAEAAQFLDSSGVDLLTLPEHLAMTNNIEQFERRYGKAPVNPHTPFIEPMVHLSWLAAVTKKIQLGTGIILSPLRPALVLGKQIASLDVLSEGRAWIGVGAGWQKEEFDACNMPWKGRYDHLVEQVRAWRELWSRAPASFHGEFINFDDLNSLPFPPQGRDLQIMFGIKGTDQNIERIVEGGGGWIPMERDPAALAEPIRKLKAAYKAKGQDPAKLEVAVYTHVVEDEHGRADLDRTLAMAPQYAEIGVTTVIYAPPQHCENKQAFAPFVEKVLRAVKG